MLASFQSIGPENTTTEAAPERSNAAVEPAQAASTGQSRLIQRCIGNQARLRLAGTRTSPPIQPKLTIGAVNDPLEHEADRVAESVMRVPEASVGFTPSPVRVERKCAACEEEEKGKVHAKEATDGGSPVADAPSTVYDTLNTAGEPLQTSDRSFFEPRFGRDFSDVRIHTDQLAATSAGGINARAYTVGNRIVFGSGQFDTKGPEGKRLMAHELAHVVQHGGGRPISVQRDPNVTTQDKDKPTAAEIAQCMDCTPVNTITKKDGNTTIFFGLCNKDLSPFNTGGGSILSAPCTPQQTSAPAMIDFSAGASGSAAWGMKPTIGTCFMPPRAANAGPVTKWEFGFIQTVESATSGAKYDNGKFTSVKVGNFRDALTPTTAAPWYDAVGGAFGPQTPPTTPVFTDTPHVPFRAAHDSTVDKDWLRSVCMNAKFHLWLVIHEKGQLPKSTADVDFLYNWNISQAQNFILSAGAHPCNNLQWMATGMLKLDSSGPGQGSATPIFTGATAGASQVRDTTITADPCASTTQAQGQPAPQAPPVDKK